MKGWIENRVRVSSKPNERQLGDKAEREREFQMSWTDKLEPQICNTESVSELPFSTHSHVENAPFVGSANLRSLLFLFPRLFVSGCKS